MNEENVLENIMDQYADGVDVLSPEFDRTAYTAFLIEKHTKAMQEIKQGQEITWHIQPEALDIYSANFDPAAFIDERIQQAKSALKLNALIEKLAGLPETDTAANTEDMPRTWEVATMQGALTTINGRLAIPSMAEFEDIFSPDRVKILPTGSTTTNESGAVELKTNTDIKSAWKTNAAKMAALLQMATPSYENEERRIQVYLPTVCRELSIDPRKYSTLREHDARDIKAQRIDAFYEWLRPLEQYMSLLNGIYYRVCIMEGYNSATETATLSLPFFLRLLEVMQQKKLNHGQLNKYFHSNVANEENEVAIAVAFYLGNCILQLGTQPNEEGTKVIYRIKYATLINNCPQLNKTLSDIANKPTLSGEKDTRTQAYNTKLKRILETAYRIILEKSEFPKLYLDFRINGVSEWEDPQSRKKRKDNPKEGNRRTPSRYFNIPTKSKLNTTLKITHNGKNKQYNQNI